MTNQDVRKAIEHWQNIYSAISPFQKDHIKQRNILKITIDALHDFYLYQQRCLGKLEKVIEEIIYHWLQDTANVNKDIWRKEDRLELSYTITRTIRSLLGRRWDER